MHRQFVLVSVLLLSLFFGGCLEGDGGCEPGTQGCACLADGVCSTPGMACQQGVCKSEFPVPENPLCYSPCRTGMQGDDGAYLSCSADGLMEGCLETNQCTDGSCVPPGAEPSSVGTCTRDSECPDFQICIGDRCYSNCQQDAECNDGWLCHRYACRLPCNTTSNPCLGSDRVCIPHDGDNGFCMPGQPSSGKHNQVDGTFALSVRQVTFTNVKPDGSFMLKNSHPSPQDFVITRHSHTGYGESGTVTVTQEDGDPLFWLQIGKSGSLSAAKEITLHLQPWDEVEILIEEAGSVEVDELKNRWDGMLMVSNHQMGSQELHLRFVSRPDGQWSGTMYYFASFRDEGIEEWQASGNAGPLENAFLVYWDEFKRGQRGLSQFLAMLTSTIDETWKYAWVQEYGNCSFQENACFPDDSPQGYGIYTQDLKDHPIPTGAIPFPVAMNLKQETTRTLGGRIVTGQTLHYIGEPAVTVEFEIDPKNCRPNNRGVVVCELAGFEAQVAVGGRYLLTDEDAITDCPDYADASYDVNKTPWLIPGFTVGTAREDGLRYHYECRDTRLPFGDDESPLINQSYAASNPIPDGRTRLRTVSLVDGAMINGTELFIIFKEHFESFMGADDTEGFAAYGVMRLVRTTAKLEDQDFQGSEVTEDRQFEEKLLDVGCSDTLLEEIKAATNTLYDPDNSAQVDALANTVLYGGPALTDAAVLDETSEEKVHWLCEDTGLIDGRYRAGTDDYFVPCPEDSNVIFFTLTPGTAAADIDTMLASQSCDNEFEAGTIDYDVTIGTDEDGYNEAADTFHNSVQVEVLTAGSCFDTIQGWRLDTERYETGGPMPAYIIRMDPAWRCEDPTHAYCSEDRFDLRNGKLFYAEPETDLVAFIHAQAAVSDAFRYKTRFRSRTGKTVGFAPSICVANSAAIPYCYDPEGMEKLVDRINCLVHLFINKGDQLDPVVRQEVLDFLRMNFAYEMVTEDSQGNMLEFPIIHEGFERLYAELLIMMGDEAYTAAFASRFDLAGSAIRSFEGSLFEPPDGINLSGGAGFEMYSLYQATQYYQMALDRFYSLSPLIWRTLTEGTQDTSFITQESVTAYFDRLIRASTQKSRAWSEVAKRYQQFNRPDLARRVVARAYTATYLESVVLSRMMLKMESVVELADWPQISERVEMAQYGYRSALMKMRDVYDNISDLETIFGYAPDFIPFPAMDPLDTNAFEKVLATAKEALDVAAEKEAIALSTTRSFDTDAEAFQAELVSIRNNYENQLADLCGTFEGEDGRIYPATPKYADMHSNLRAFPKDPCGMVNNGKIYEARTEVDLAGLSLKRARMDLDDKISEIRIEQDRVVEFCQLVQGDVDFLFDTQSEINGMRAGIHAAEQIRETALRAENIAEHMAEITQCDPMGDCATAGIAGASLGVIYAANSLIVTGASIGIRVMEVEIEKLEQAQARWELERECDYARVESDALVRTLLLDLGSLQVELLKAMLQFQMASAKVVQLVNEAKRMRDEQTEVEQLAINVAAAKNDPNSRIYKNDAVLTADRTFDTAVQAAYRATRVYEYYTSQSYAPLIDLFLVRMVSHGDITLESYLSELDTAFMEFEDLYGNPDLRVEVMCLKDDIFDIERYDQNQTPLSSGARTELMRQRLTDVALLDARGYIVIPFATRLDDLSPLTRNHKIHYLEAQLLGTDLGDSIARVYLTGRGTGTVRGVDGEKSFYRFPGRTAVLNAIVGEQRVFEGNVFEGDVYKNKRLRDMPLVNTGWELVINQRDEKSNQDVNLMSLDDICLYIYYTDFTELD